ncbi:TetR/AcrR family transcriptional regulator [Flavobacterium sp. 7A]|uniref:TetR/AcrR family transcriptional regulator n=1 Tax=Flavobacterium sp. 7A TaxID=2940571 RepID=UPI002226DDDE|nr:TetR/AcrR family transcriptional regulator [Flavobacterium sp. 7A]MCW2119618.1 TetR/AcrR family transcriptional repressor of nem operon [Flavobacterium sp. 7A]
MARKKQYIEEQVIEKAMALFWRNGYENTSVRMLEQEMGINQFSIYASFGNKQGVFIESLKAYKKRIRSITDVLENSNNGIKGIKDYFYSFLEFSKEGLLKKGCLVTNTINEIGDNDEDEIRIELMNFFGNIIKLFHKNLAQDHSKNESTIETQANYLGGSMLGLSMASKMMNEKQLKDYIETIFIKL